VKPSWGYRIVTDDLARQQRLLSRGQFPMELVRNWSLLWSRALINNANHLDFDSAILIGPLPQPHAEAK